MRPQPVHLALIGRALARRACRGGIHAVLFAQFHELDETGGKNALQRALIAPANR